MRRFRHYKGGEYEYICEARHSETEEAYIVYRPLGRDSGVWIRPKEMFFEEIEINGVRTPRFAEIKE